jgi:hypothetical protein
MQHLLIRWFRCGRPRPSRQCVMLWPSGPWTNVQATYSERCHDAAIFMAADVILVRGAGRRFLVGAQHQGVRCWKTLGIAGGACNLVQVGLGGARGQVQPGGTVSSRTASGRAIAATVYQLLKRRVPLLEPWKSILVHSYLCKWMTVDDGLSHCERGADLAVFRGAESTRFIERRVPRIGRTSRRGAASVHSTHVTLPMLTLVYGQLGRKLVVDPRCFCRFPATRTMCGLK